MTDLSPPGGPVGVDSERISELQALGWDVAVVLGDRGAEYYAELRGARPAGEFWHITPERAWAYASMVQQGIV